MGRSDGKIIPTKDIIILRSILEDMIEPSKNRKLELLCVRSPGEKRKSKHDEY
jgi:hypothetical protein